MHFRGCRWLHHSWYFPSFNGSPWNESAKCSLFIFLSCAIRFGPIISKTTVDREIRFSQKASARTGPCADGTSTIDARIFRSSTTFQSLLCSMSTRTVQISSFLGSGRHGHNRTTITSATCADPFARSGDRLDASDWLQHVCSCYHCCYCCCTKKSNKAVAVEWENIRTISIFKNKTRIINT